MKLSAVEALCENIPRVKQAFENHEGSFAPPTGFGTRTQLSLNVRIRESANQPLRVRKDIREPVSVFFDYKTREEVVFKATYTPSYEWIKRHLKGTEILHIAPTIESFPFLYKESSEYLNFKKFIDNECNVNEVVIYLKTGPVDDVLELFRNSERRAVRCLEDCTFQLSEQVLSKLTAYEDERPLRITEILRYFEYKNILNFNLISLDFFEFIYLAQTWKRGERAIGTWKITCTNGTDMDGGYEFCHNYLSRYLRVKSLHKFGRIEISIIQLAH